MGRISANISTDIPCDLFLNGLCVGFSKQVEQNTAEVMCVTVWIAQLVCNCIQEQVSPWKTQTISYPFAAVTWCRRHDWRKTIENKRTKERGKQCGGYFFVMYTMSSASTTSPLDWKCANEAVKNVEDNTRNFSRRYFAILLVSLYLQYPGPQPSSGRCPCETNEWWLTWRECRFCCECRWWPVYRRTELTRSSEARCTVFQVH